MRNDEPPAEREFWEVWSEERAQPTGAQGTSERTGANDTSIESSAFTPPAFDAPAPSLTSLPSTHRPMPEDRSPQDGPRTDAARLYLNLGRKDGASEREIRSLLESRAPGATVAEVDVMNTHTYLNVAPADAERIIAAVAGQELGGRQLICEAAKPRRR